MEANEYIASLPAQVRTQLLKQPHCCVAIFKCLNQSERHALLRLLSGNMPVKFIVPPADPNSEPGAVLPSLTKLKVVEKHGNLVVLDADFKKNLMTALSASPTAYEGGAASPTRMAELIEYTKTKWENLIQPLLACVFPSRFDSGGPSKSKRKVDSDGTARIVEMLSSAGLMENGNITKLGYLFLLKEIPKQIWQLVQCYITSQVTESQKTSAISFLIFLGTLSAGNPYDISILTKSEKSLLRDWALFGLVELLPQDKYTVTPLTWQITSSQNAGAATEIGRWTRGIIVESNFMIYAYTDSAIVIGLLELFAEVTSRLPNLCLAKLTRRSVREAFRYGFSAENIISYLRQNKHTVHTPKGFGTTDEETLILNGGFDDADGPDQDEDVRIGGIPESVEEQVFLWQDERTRFKPQPGVLYEDFDSKEMFTKVKQYADDMGVLIWSSVDRQSIFVADVAHERIKQYVRSLNTMQ